MIKKNQSLYDWSLPDLLNKKVLFKPDKYKEDFLILYFTETKPKTVLRVRSHYELQITLTPFFRKAYLNYVQNFFVLEIKKSIKNGEKNLISDDLDQVLKSAPVFLGEMPIDGNVVNISQYFPTDIPQVRIGRKPGTFVLTTVKQDEQFNKTNKGTFKIIIKKHEINSNGTYFMGEQPNP